MNAECPGSTLRRAALIAILGIGCAALAGCAASPPVEAHAPGPGRPVPREAPALIERLLDLRIAAEAAYGAARWSEAERIYDELLALDPSDVRDWHRRGTLHLRGGRLAAAAAAFERALAIDSGRGETWHNLALVQLAQALMSLRAASRLIPPGSEGDATVARAAAVLRSLLPSEILSWKDIP